jgi:Mg/Co/Ni transporter MgtE
MIRKFIEDTTKVNEQPNLSELQKQVNQSILSKLQNQERALMKQIGENDRPPKSIILNKQVAADQMSVTVAAKIKRLAAFDRLSQTLKPPTPKA